VRSCNHFWRVKTLSVKYCLCVYMLALVIRYVMRMRRIFMCGLYGCTILFHIIS